MSLPNYFKQTKHYLKIEHIIKPEYLGLAALWINSNSMQVGYKLSFITVSVFGYSKLNA